MSWTATDRLSSRGPAASPIACRPVLGALLAVGLICEATPALSQASYNPSPNSANCPAQQEKVVRPTAACGYNRLGAMNPGVFTRYLYASGDRCVWGERFDHCGLN